MQLQVDVNSVKSELFLEMLNLFKKDNMIDDYKIITPKNYDEEVLADIKGLQETVKDAKRGLGHKSGKTVTIQE